MVEESKWTEPRLNRQPNAVRMERVTLSAASQWLRAVSAVSSCWFMSTDWILVSENWRGVGEERVTERPFFKNVFLCFLAAHSPFHPFSFFLLLLPKYFARQLASSSFRLHGPTGLAKPFIILRGRRGCGRGLLGGEMVRGASTPSQVLGVNINLLLVSFARFAHVAVLKLAGVCAPVQSGGGAMLRFGGSDRMVWEKGEGVQVRGGWGEIHSSSSFVIFVRWTVKGVMTFGRFLREPVRSTSFRSKGVERVGGGEEGGARDGLIRRTKIKSRMKAKSFIPMLMTLLL